MVGLARLAALFLAGWAGRRGLSGAGIGACIGILGGRLVWW
jgi:hypothetical protein